MQRLILNDGHALVFQKLFMQRAKHPLKWYKFSNPWLKKEIMLL
jgi:hypothetical protein